MLENGLLKFVNRLSIQFKGEDSEKFEERLNLTKERQKKADDAVKLLRFIDTVDDKLVANMPEKMVDSLKSNFKSNSAFPLLMD